MGSLYTSILPHVISKEIKKAIKEAKAKKMYICNAVTQPGETDNFTVSDHIKLLNHYIGKNSIDVVVASNSKISKDIVDTYSTEEQKDLVLIDEEELLKLGVEIIAEDLITLEDGTIKHDSLKLSATVFNYIMRL